MKDSIKARPEVIAVLNNFASNFDAWEYKLARANDFKYINVEKGITLQHTFLIWFLIIESQEEDLELRLNYFEINEIRNIIQKREIIKINRKRKAQKEKDKEVCEFLRLNWFK